jgi:hypothetical protein
MRRRFRVLILAAIVAAVVVRVGFALSLQSGSLQSGSLQSGSLQSGSLQAGSFQTGSFPTSAVPQSAVMMNSTQASASLQLGSSSRHTLVQQSPFLPDGATLLGLGTVLLGLAAAVRKAV